MQTLAALSESRRHGTLWDSKSTNDFHPHFKIQKAQKIFFRMLKLFQSCRAVLLSLLPRRRKDFGSLEIVDLPKKKLKTAKLKLHLCRNGGLAKPLYHCHGSILRSLTSKHDFQPTAPSIHDSQPAPGRFRMQTSSILRYILHCCLTCRTVAKILWSHGHLHSAVCNARPIANV